PSRPRAAHLRRVRAVADAGGPAGPRLQPPYVARGALEERRLPRPAHDRRPRTPSPGEARDRAAHAAVHPHRAGRGLPLPRPMSPFRSVRVRLAFALLLVVAGVLAIVYLIVVPSYKTSLENNELNTLQKQLLTRAVPTFPAAPFLKQQYASTLSPELNARVVVFNLGNIKPSLLLVVADSDVEGDSSDVESDPVAFNAIRLQTVARGTVTRNGQEYAEVAYPLASSVILLSAPLHDQLQVVSVVRTRVVVAGVLATAFAMLLGYAGASMFARRLRRLEVAAERIAAGDFEEPVIDHRTDELGQLARTFERMRLRLASLDRARGEFIANASHELRTPLFSLGGFLELMDDPELDEA